MKTPDSWPRFQTATRHYHRYREENQDGWSEWISTSKKTSGRKSRRWLWLTASIAVSGLLAWGTIALFG